MSNDVIFYTQISTVVIFILALFGIYRSLVSNKDSVIELLKERIVFLSERIEALESQTPDALAEALSNRVERQLSEISRLKEDGEQHQEEISLKEAEINEARDRLSALSDLIKDSDLVCPECGAPLTRREFYTISGYSGGREVEADVEYVEYDCGLAINHNGETNPCKNRKP
ncbi:hypothetical protein [Shewanella algae]|uniref:hypothetical protein n=1 Tax=Shewanella algae TaxID=38313 RepID=UPI0031F516AA